MLRATSVHKTLIFIWSILMVLSHPAAAEVAIAPREVALTFPVLDRRVPIS